MPCSTLSCPYAPLPEYDFNNFADGVIFVSTDNWETSNSIAVQYVTTEDDLLYAQMLLSVDGEVAAHA